jgi:hypothetical protein
LSSHQEEDNLKESASLAENMDLPGLTSPSVIPILAKVEFDIDRRKAVWFDPWVRSRKMNQAKRDASAVRSAFPSSSAAKPPPSSSSEEEEGEGEGEKASTDARKPPLPLALIDGEESAGYTRLKNSDSSSSLSSTSEYADDDDHDDDNDAKDDEDNHDHDTNINDGNSSSGNDDGNATARQTLVTPGKNHHHHLDPLEDVFGTDADAWAEIHADANFRLSSLGTAPIIQPPPNPHIVDLALSGADLSAERFASEEGSVESEEGDNDDDSSYSQSGGDHTEDVEEVLEIMEKMEGQKPKLSVEIPEQSSPPNKRKSTPVTASTIRKHIPPPLNIPPMPDGLTASLEATASPLPNGAAGPNSAHSGTRLPYLKEDGRTPSTENDNPVNEKDLEKISEADLTIEFRSSPGEEKRGGGIFDDLDLGLGEVKLLVGFQV